MSQLQKKLIFIQLFEDFLLLVDMLFSHVELRRCSRFRNENMTRLENTFQRRRNCSFFKKEWFILKEKSSREYPLEVEVSSRENELSQTITEKRTKINQYFSVNSKLYEPTEWCCSIICYFFPSSIPSFRW